MSYFFKATKLSVGYRGVPVVSEIDVSVSRGQILTIIGPNGCGKSTILKSITKQLETLTGTISLAGEILQNIDRQQLAKRASLVLTERPKPELMTAGDVVAVGRYPYTGMFGSLSDDDYRKIEQAMRMVGALDLKDRRFDQLSDGQLQRVLLARAIAQEPEIMVLDEPTSYLDIRFAIEIIDILRQMADQHHVSVIMSLHELSYAKRVSDLVMGIKEGHVRVLAAPSAVFNKNVISDLFDLPDGTYDELFGGL